MSTTPVLTSSIDVQAPQWIVVPAPHEATAEWRAEVVRLFAAVAEIDRAAAEGDPDAQPFASDGEVDPDAALDTLLEFRAALGEEQRLVAGLGIPNRWPLPVVVTVAVADDDGPDLLRLAGAEGGLPVDRPAVDELPEHVRGEGPIVTRYDIDDDGAIWGSICAVRREELDGGARIDTQLLWRTRDLDVVPVFGAELVDLMASVRNEVQA
jgi:hypothetical protein